MKNFKSHTDANPAGQSSHYTQGINVFSLLTVCLFNAQLWAQVSWWWLPVTILFALVAWANEIHPRRKTTNTLTLS